MCVCPILLRIVFLFGLDSGRKKKGRLLATNPDLPKP